MKWLSKLRITWVLMIVVVVISLAGANKIMHGPALPRPAALPVREAAGGVARGVPRAAGVVATGIVTPEGDIVPLHPSVKGEVVEVLVKNDDKVKKGQVLLRMDDRDARNLLEQAIEGVSRAELLVRRAKEGMRQFELERQIQVKKIAIRRAEFEAAQEKLKRLKELVDKKLSATADADYSAALKGMTALQLAIEAEEKGLELVDAKKPTSQQEEAESGVRFAKSQQRRAQLGVDMCELRAPADGTIMQVLASPGWKFGEQAVKPAFLFYSGGLIVKADINQEYASRVKVDMPVVIHDHAGSGQQWKGRVIHLASSFLPPKRDVGEIAAPLLQQAGEPVLECRIALDPGQPAPFLNQKVRVHIGQ